MDFLVQNSRVALIVMLVVIIVKKTLNLQEGVTLTKLSSTTVEVLYK